MKVYLLCGKKREISFRDILGGDFVVESLSGEDPSRVSNGDVVLADLVPRGHEWRNELAGLRRAVGEEIRLVAVLETDQLRSLSRSNPLDDFVAEDSAPEEITARLRRLAKDEAPGTLPVGEMEIDENRYEVRVSGVPVELTYKEFELLRFLADRPGKVFTREILLEQVWGYDYFGGSRTVDVHIRRIRSKIEREGHTYIRTVRGVGYIFEHKPI